MSPAAAVCVEIGQRMRCLRLAQNLTQAQLAVMTGVSLSSVRRMASDGQTTLEASVRAAQALQVTQHLEGMFEAAHSMTQVESPQHVSTRLRARPLRSARSLKI